MGVIPKCYVIDMAQVIAENLILMKHFWEKYTVKLEKQMTMLHSITLLITNNLGKAKQT